jgi:chemotaxis protein methyltransferase CheR
MMVPAQPSCMTDGEFEVFRELVRSETGIALGPHKRALLEARLAKRLRALGLPTFSAYYTHLRRGDPYGEERTRFVNAVTTNETAFFRETAHFAHLEAEWLPARRALADAGGPRRLRAWSAACSTGEEPYSIAMTWLASLDAARWDLRILATDIDTDVLTRAAAGIYRLEAVERLPTERVRRFFLRGVGRCDGSARIRPEVRDLVTFRRVNLLEAPWPIRTQFDLIFCRNVLMYFDRPTQATLVARLERMLAPDGLLVLGHAENLLGLDSTMQRVTSTIYRLGPGSTPRRAGETSCTPS